MWAGKSRCQQAYTAWQIRKHYPHGHTVWVQSVLPESSDGYWWWIIVKTGSLSYDIYFRGQSVAVTENPP